MPSYPLAKAAKATFCARALLVGERLDLRSMEGVERWASDPVTLSAGACGVAVLFRYGAIVLFDVAPLEEAEFLRQLRPFIQQPYPQPETESLNLTIQPGANEGMEGNTVRLTDHTIERIQLVADILSKSTVLARYEVQVRQSFERIEGIAGIWQARLMRPAGVPVGQVVLNPHSNRGCLQGLMRLDPFLPH